MLLKAQTLTLLRDVLSEVIAERRDIVSICRKAGIKTTGIHVDQAARNHWFDVLEELNICERRTLDLFLMAVLEGAPGLHTRLGEILEPEIPLPALENFHSHPSHRLRSDFLLGRDPAALFCDRYDQWVEFLELARTPRSEVVLVPGARGQGHAYFQMRIEIEVEYREALPCRVLHFQSARSTLPVEPRGFQSAWAQMLDCRETDVEESLNRLLAHRNLLVLHPSIGAGIDAVQGAAGSSPWVEYYTHWLPKLLHEARPIHGLKCVQPLDWLPYPLTLQRLARLMGGVWPRDRGWIPRALQERWAKELIEVLKRGADRELPMVCLPDLTQITAAHVLNFCERIGLPESMRPDFVGNVLYGAQTSEQILQNIARVLPELRKESQ